MNLICFVADNTADALAEVHKRLGPDAVIVNVRQLPAPGLARLWNFRKQIEVTAGVPDKTSAPKVENILPPQNLFENAAGFVSNGDRWHSVAWLETMGLMPVHAERLQTHLRALQGDAPDSPEAEWKIVSAALSRFWLNPPPLDGDVQSPKSKVQSPPIPRPHVFIGPPGSGKTTALCKWLTLAALLEERAARVWRLDGATANTADFLAIHCEMLGVPLERFWSEDLRFTNDDLRAANPSAGQSQIVNRKSQIVNPLWFVDLPGVEIADGTALTALRNQLATFPSPRVHLVLNAAYEMPALLAQWRAFEACQPEDLIFTHLDEEARRVKLWNFVFGTNCSLRFLGAGQKIPGEFRSASPEFLFPVKSP
jgi:flagellar biosynthesis protein FlhF